MNPNRTYNIIFHNSTSCHLSFAFFNKGKV